MGDTSTMHTSQPMISDKDLSLESDTQTLALHIVREIQDKRNIGYAGRNQPVASALTFALTCMATRYKWHVHASTDTDQDGFLYTVWIERKE